VIAGFVAVLVGFTSSAVIVFQAAQTLHASACRDRLVDVCPGGGHGPDQYRVVNALPRAGPDGLVHALVRQC
jgi:uncharacterized membrane protein (DUF2068 family)